MENRVNKNQKVLDYFLLRQVFLITDKAFKFVDYLRPNYLYFYIFSMWKFCISTKEKREFQFFNMKTRIFRHFRKWQSQETVVNGRPLEIWLHSLEIWNFLLFLTLFFFFILSNFGIKMADIVRNQLFFSSNQSMFFFSFSLMFQRHALKLIMTFE